MAGTSSGAVLANFLESSWGLMPPEVLTSVTGSAMDFELSPDLDAALDELSDWQWSGPAVLELTLRREEVPPFAPFLPADAPVIDKPAEGHALPVPSPFRPRAA